MTSIMSLKRCKTRKEIIVSHEKRNVYSFNYYNILYNNLDVMYIKKNIYDNILKILLDIPEKTKDRENVRFDL